MDADTSTAGDGENLGSGAAFYILSSLAGGEKHGYALTKDIEGFARVRLAPGTLYEALARLEARGLIEPVPSDDRRKPYRLSGAGAAALDATLREHERVTRESRARLRRTWRLA
jgi:DNA-binding PadR family transcriptional regulator